ncbi:MAG TPA: 4-hydroxy-tetrahydrodipicolinate synthase [Methylomirabilota bacterium]|nr:4-hydroxy-tetrahydrodipicolinate synthase [Methylomirabilota bacterium]
MDDLVGLFPALPTPTDTAGNVDVKATARLVDFLCAAGIDGLVPVGGTGEYAALSPADRRAMVEATVAAAAGRVPVVAGVLATGFKDAIQAASDFTAAGAAGLMLVTPYYVTPTQEGIREYFRAFAQEVTVPVLLYEIPYRTGVALKAETIAQMADDGSIVGMKACNPDFNQFTRVIQLVGERISVMSGEEPFFATHVALGARGGILATANLFPKVWQEVFALARAGDLKGALARQQRLLPLLDAAFAETNPGPLKEAMAMIGLPVGHVLRPLERPRPETMVKLEAAVRAMQES